MSMTLTKYYDRKKKRLQVISTPLVICLKPKIARLSMGKTWTELKMTPQWFEQDDEMEVLRNIVYPEGICPSDENKFNSVARYRAAVGRPANDFIKNSFDPKETNPETVIIGLDDFVQSFGGELTFTDRDFSFNDPAHRAACGITDLGSAHLLFAEYIPTAKFQLSLDLDYQIDLARSADTMQNFVLDFSRSIAEIVDCESDYVRVVSVNKQGKKRNESRINFGLTTPKAKQTEELAEQLTVCLSLIELENNF